MKKIILLAVACLLFLPSCARRNVVVSEDAPYVLQFREGFNRGMNFVDDLGISIVIIVDVSGSMTHPPAAGGKPKFVQTANALDTVSSYLADLARSQGDMKINVGVLKFSNDVSIVLPLTELKGDGFEKMAAACVPANFEPTGRTGIGLALEKGSEMLAESGTVFRSMILVTDGANTEDPDPFDVMEAIYANRNNMSDETYRIGTSTQLISLIGFDINSPEFARYKEMGARVTSAGNQQELEESLRNLLEADITKLE